MYYLITVPAKGFLNQLEVEHLQQFKDALDKSNVHAFVKVGGGLVMIVQQPSHEHLTTELRKHQIMDADVTPLLPLTKVLEGYIEHKTTGKVGHELIG